MKLYASLLLLSSVSFAQTGHPITGEWTGTAIAHHQQVPVQLEISGELRALKASFVNGKELSPATSATLTGDHLVITFDYYARTLDAVLGPDGKLSGSFGTASVRYPVTLSPGKRFAGGFGNARLRKPALDGDWEIAVKSAKGESAWQLRIEQPPYRGNTVQIKAVIQRIDGDTGSLYGECADGDCLVSHFTPAGPALYRFRYEEGTLLVSNLLHADLTPPDQQDLVARRPDAARAAGLAKPTDPTQQTTMKDPTARFAFSAPDLTGKTISNTDRQFDGKVVIVTVGGSWCPNCHDEAPFFESLYKQFHARGLEIVNLSFEEDQEQLKNPERLRAFIARYHLDYTILLAGTTEQLNEKVPQADRLNSWPTSFFIARDGRVRQIHAGFAGPANPVAHEELVKEVTALVSEMLAEPVPTQSASR